MDVCRWLTTIACLINVVDVVMCHNDCSSSEVKGQAMGSPII